MQCMIQSEWMFRPGFSKSSNGNHWVQTAAQTDKSTTLNNYAYFAIRPFVTNLTNVQFRAFCANTKGTPQELFQMEYQLFILVESLLHHWPTQNTIKLQLLIQSREYVQHFLSFTFTAGCQISHMHSGVPSGGIFNWHKPIIRTHNMLVHIQIGLTAKEKGLLQSTTYVLYIVYSPPPLPCPAQRYIDGSGTNWKRGRNICKWCQSKC